MKTWLILIYLTTTIASSFSQEVLDGSTKEDGLSLAFQDAVTEETEPQRTGSKGIVAWFWGLFKKEVLVGSTTEDGLSLAFQDAGTEETEPQRTGSKGIVAWFRGFFKKEVTEGKTEDAPLLLSHDAATAESELLEPRVANSDSIGGQIWQTWKLFRSRLTFGYEPFQVTVNVINEVCFPCITAKPEEQETPKETSFEEQDTTGSEAAFKSVTSDNATILVPQIRGHDFQSSEDASATAKPTTAPTRVETTTVPSGPPLHYQPHTNPWAPCNSPAPAPAPDEEEILAEALTDFALKFYETLIKYEGGDSNFVFSPLSISMLLSNLLLGARQETKERLEKLLHYPQELTCVHASLEKLRKSEAMSSASAIFYNPALTLNSDFCNMSRRFYKSRLLKLTNNSFHDMNEINEWVSQNTNHKIKKLLDELESDIQMMIINVVYFHSKWKTIFKVKNTVKENFYRPGLPPIQVPTMTSKKYPVAIITDPILKAKVGRLQLAHNMSLVLIVPQYQSQNLSDVEKRLDGNAFKSMMAKLASHSFKPTIVSLPKFKVDSSLDLLRVVGDMDYGIFFDSNLSGISENEEMGVSSARHKAVLDISEEGMEAAAATAVSLARVANYFEVQQPFLFLLSRDQPPFPIFMGRINNPLM